MDSNNILLCAALVSVPISIISMFNTISTNKRVDILNDIIARQHNINPQSVKNLAGEKLPFIRRTIAIKDVKFNDNGVATIYFNDEAMPGMLYNQSGCPSIAKHIGKRFTVDYNTVAANYAINCSKFKL